MAAETGFDIEGTIYEVPTLDSLDMDECQVLYDYSGLTVEDFVPLAEDADEDETEAYERKLKNPGLVRALLHIAYQRGNPKAKPDVVRGVMKKAKMLAIYAALAGGAEPEDGDDVPPVLTSEPHESSLSDSLENDVSNEKKSVNGGDGSTNGSDLQAVTPALTGTIR